MKIAAAPVSFASLIALAALVALPTPAFAAQPDGPSAPAEPPPLPPTAGAGAAVAGSAETPPSSGPETVSPDRAFEGAARYDLVRINAGVRIGYVATSGFDSFASSDVLSQFSIDGTYPVFHRGRLVVGVGLGWDVGGRSDKIRGFDSSLTAHRLSVPIEARWHVTPWLFGFGKVAPGATAMLVKLSDGSAPSDLSTTAWAFSADASLGASILMGPRQHLDKRVVRFWLTPELGYSYTTNAPIKPNTGRDEKDVLGSDEDARLRTLALSGFFWRATIGTTF